MSSSEVHVLIKLVRKLDVNDNLKITLSSKGEKVEINVYKKYGYYVD